MRATESQKVYWENHLYGIHFTNAGIRVDNYRMATCDWPIQYSHSGKVAYDHPEWFPQYVKSKMYNAFETYREWRASQ
jgi:hypothetical protein